MKLYRSTLQQEDIVFFHKILFQYEKEAKDGGHKGYNFRKIPTNIRKSISLIHDTDKSKITLQTPSTKNIIIFKGNQICVPLIKHIRNCFAHACIERDGNYYIFNKDLIIPKCKISGIVERGLLWDLVNEILKTKKI